MIICNKDREGFFQLSMRTRTTPSYLSLYFWMVFWDQDPSDSRGLNFVLGREDVHSKSVNSYGEILMEYV